jgi:hypothetical protein
MGSRKMQRQPVQPRKLKLLEVVSNKVSVAVKGWATVEVLRQTGQFIER